LRRRATMPDGASDEEIVKRLDLIASLLALPTDAGESEKIAAASRVGLKGIEVSRIFGKTPAAARKALERARKKK
jgi:hypothetical protein